MSGKGVSESERIWKSIDRCTSTLAGLCERVTKNEVALVNFQTYLENHQKHKDKQTVAFIAVIGVTLTAINIFI